MTPTPEQFAASLAAIADDMGDLQKIHGEMDDLLEGLLRDLGYGEAMDIYHDQDKWYA